MKPGVLLRAAGAPAVLAMGLFFASVGSTFAASSTLYVSPGAHSGGSGMSCSSAKYSTIGAAVMAAPAGSKIYVCTGVYAESVMVNKALELEGHGAVVNATGHDNGFLITSSWTEVEGFTVWGATAEGILAAGTPMQITLGGMPVTTGTPVTHVTIAHNVVKFNDRGDFGTASTNPECATQGNVPGDCGEGIHLMGAAWSTVWGNTVHDNSGGILLTDELGPNHDNLVAGNFVYHNTLDCGITLPSHNVGINPMTHQLLPTIGGVFNNVVRGNTVFANGLAGEGAGIGIFSPAPVTAAYNNLVTQNLISGNEQSGVTLHTHAPGAYLNGNRITYNRIGNNNVGGDPDPGVMQTTGVLVDSPLSPVTITIQHNAIFHDHFGIWLSTNVTASGTSDNSFIDVGVKVFHQ